MWQCVKCFYFVAAYMWQYALFLFCCDRFALENNYLYKVKMAVLFGGLVHADSGKALGLEIYLHKLRTGKDGRKRLATPV